MKWLIKTSTKSRLAVQSSSSNNNKTHLWRPMQWWWMDPYFKFKRLPLYVFASGMPETQKKLVVHLHTVMLYIRWHWEDYIPFGLQPTNKRIANELNFRSLDRAVNSTTKCSLKRGAVCLMQEIARSHIVIVICQKWVILPCMFWCTLHTAQNICQMTNISLSPSEMLYYSNHLIMNMSWIWGALLPLAEIQRQL